MNHPNDHMIHLNDHMIHPNDHMIHPNDHMNHLNDHMIHPNDHMNHLNDHMIYPQWSHDLDYIVWIPDPFDQARKGLGCNLAPNCWNDAISVVEERTPLWLIEHTVDSW